MAFGIPLTKPSKYHACPEILDTPERMTYREDVKIMVEKAAGKNKALWDSALTAHTVLYRSPCLEGTICPSVYVTC